MQTGTLDIRFQLMVWEESANNYLEGALIQFNGGSVEFVACLRYFSAYAAAFSLPWAMLSTGSNGAIQCLAFTL